MGRGAHEDVDYPDIKALSFPAGNFKTADQWWEQVEAHWENIEALYHDANVPLHYQIHIFLEREARIGKDRVTYMKRAFEGLNPNLTFWDAMTLLKQRKDPKLWLLFQGLWEDVPDNFTIHSYHYWGHFCDLCSEGMWLLFPEPKEEPT